jgi:glycerol-3-phosphate dehydrogenase (NAD(P)+)
MSQKVAIIGAGRFGNSLARLFRRVGAKVALWDVEPKKVSGQRSFEDTISQADAVFFCTPSFALEKSLKDAKPILKRSCIVVSPIKGMIDGKNDVTAVEMIRQCLPGQPFAILGGPMLAEEMDKGLGGTAVIAADDFRTARHIGRLFAASAVNVTYSTDSRGVALAGILKNVYAMALGIAAGLGWGMNAKGSLVVRATAEMAKILSALGSKSETAYGMAGLGDLIATGFSYHSRNYSVGLALARGRRPSFKGEGGLSLPPLLTLLSRKKKDYRKFQILAATAKVIQGKSAARKAFQKIRTDA